MSLFPYTHNQHFQFGHQDPLTLETRWMGRRQSDDENFIAKYGRAQSEFSTWRLANNHAAKLILQMAREQNLVPVICYSGGIDSEVMLLSFIDALSKMPASERVPIEVATLQLEGDLNTHDTEYVARFQSLHPAPDLDIEFQSFKIDPIRFLNSEKFIALADETQILSPIILCHIEMCEQIHARNLRSLPIIGQGEIHLSREDDLNGNYAPRIWKIAETENLCGLYKYFAGRSRPAIPGFFQYLPEQFETQLRTNQVLHELISHSRIGKLGTRTSKADIIEFDYPELESRPKYTGFEKIMGLHDEKRAFLSQRMPACEAKWKLEVTALMDAVRAVKNEVVSVSDWSFSWSLDGTPHSMRTSSDDVFATEWRDHVFPSNFHLNEKPSQNFAIDFLISKIRDLAKAASSTTPPVLLHDGSLFARVLAAALRPSVGLQKPDVASLASVSAADVARAVLTNRIFDKDSLTLYFLAKTAETPFVIPRLHHRIVNSEFDRDLEATLVKPRFVWVENERLAVLTSALASALSSGAHVLPWTHAALAEAVKIASGAIGWFQFDEPGPSNGTPWNDFLKSVLLRLEETEEERSLAASCAADFEAASGKIESLRLRCAFPNSSFQVSSRPLSLQSSALKNNISLSHHIESFLKSNASLKIVTTSRWLEQAKRASPALRFGSNLFFQKDISGFERLNSSNSVSVAYIDGKSKQEYAWAHLTALSLPPHGRLRIRGVTTRPDLLRKGFATMLLTELTQLLKMNPPNGFRVIEVWAAPEIEKAFRKVGFVDDVARVTRAEESIDPATGEIITTDRELTPLVLYLGEV